MPNLAIASRADDATSEREDTPVQGRTIPATPPLSVAVANGVTLATGGRDDFAVSLEFFSGPMDLLLHLVHQQELPIEQVSMKVVAEQYLAIISGARLLDLDLASEYLVIAATLVSLKSESLLPAHSVTPDGELPIEERSDAFYEELRARLRAYELTKVRARLLMDTPQLGADVFTRVDRRALLPTPEMLAEPEESTTLALLFSRLLNRIGQGARAFQVRLESISVVSYMMKIIDSFSTMPGSPTSGSPREEGGGLLRFSQIARRFSRLRRGHVQPTDGDSFDDQFPLDRSVVIGSFIAVLELVKRGVLCAAQRDDRAEIEITLGMEPGLDLSQGGMTSEFDTPEPDHPSETAPSAAVGGAPKRARLHLAPRDSAHARETATNTSTDTDTARDTDTATDIRTGEHG